MLWQIILTTISAVLFFGFVALGVRKFGLLDCYSAYAPKWRSSIPGLNWWQLVTIWSALLLLPVLLGQANGNHYQFLGFLAPLSLILVGSTADYQTDKFQWWVHQAGAWSAVLLIILYTIAVPKLLWVFVPFAFVAAALSIRFKGTWMFWGEMAMYLGTYVIIYSMI